MSLRIMHTADYHIGMQFSIYGQFAQQLMEARLQAVERLVQKANRERCDLFVVGGDLFDRVSVRAQQVSEVMDALSLFEGSAVLILPGNHDYTEEQTGLWERIEANLPGHGVILDETRPYPLEQFGLSGVIVYPGPCSSRHSSDNSISWIEDEEVPSDQIAIGLAHGSLEGVSPDFDRKYYPMARRQLQEAGVDLWLLGHTHVPYPDPQEAPGSRVFYPGTPEPDGMDCQHAGGAWLLQLDDQANVSAEFVCPGQFSFEDRQVEVGSGADLQELIDHYSDADSTVLRLAVRGWIPRDDYQHYIRAGENRLHQALSDSVAYLAGLDLDELYPEIDRHLIDDEFTEGSFPHRLLHEVASEGSDEALQLAYEMVKEVQADESR